MITPFGQHVVVQVKAPNDYETAGTSGILIHTTEEVPSEGTVIALGDKVTLPLKEGDKVFIRTYGWQDYYEDKKRYLVGLEENVLGTLA